MLFWYFVCNFQPFSAELIHKKNQSATQFPFDYWLRLFKQFQSWDKNERNNSNVSKILFANQVSYTQTTHFPPNQLIHEHCIQKRKKWWYEKGTLFISRFSRIPRSWFCCCCCCSWRLYSTVGFHRCEHFSSSMRIQYQFITALKNGSWSQYAIKLRIVHICLQCSIILFNIPSVRRFLIEVIEFSLNFVESEKVSWKWMQYTVFWWWFSHKANVVENSSLLSSTWQRWSDFFIRL